MLTQAWQTQLACVFCKKTPKSVPVFSCKSGHLVCVSCYGVLSHQASGSRRKALMCKLCNRDVTDTRNAVAELLLQQCIQNPHLLSVMGNAMGSTSSVLSTYNDGDDVGEEYALSRLRLFEKKSMINLRCVSRRPICCPEPECSQVIAVTSLTTHFEFEHPRVMRMDTNTDTAEEYILWGECLTEAYYYLVGFLLVRNFGYGQDSRSSQQTSVSGIGYIEDENIFPVYLFCSTIKLPIPAAVAEAEVARRPARLPRPTGTASPGVGYDDAGRPCSLHSSGDCRTPSPSIVRSPMRRHPRRKRRLHRKPSEMANVRPCLASTPPNLDDFMVFWASALETDNSTLSVTLEVSDFQKSLVYRYHGQLNSLRDDQDPCAVFCRGQCLIVQATMLPNLLNAEDEFSFTVVLHSC